MVDLDLVLYYAFSLLLRDLDQARGKNFEYILKSNGNL